MILRKEEPTKDVTNYITDGTCPMCGEAGVTRPDSFLDQPRGCSDLLIRCIVCNLIGMARGDHTVIWSVVK
jgi:hypothetical protein